MSRSRIALKKRLRNNNNNNKRASKSDDRLSRHVERRETKSRSTSNTRTRARPRSRTRSRSRSKQHSRKSTRSKSRSKYRSRSKSRSSKQRSTTPLIDNSKNDKEERERNEKKEANSNEKKQSRRIVIDENNNHGGGNHQIDSSPQQTSNPKRSKSWGKSTMDSLEVFRQIYYETNQKLHTETYLRLADLVIKKKLEISDLKQAELLESFEIFNDKNITLLDEFLDDSQNYSKESGALNIEKLFRGLKNLKIFVDLPSVLKLSTGLKSALMSTPIKAAAKEEAEIKKEAIGEEKDKEEEKMPHDKNVEDDEDEGESVLKIEEQEDLSMPMEEEKLDGLKKRGYEHLITERSRIIRSIIREDFEQLDPSDCYGTPLRLTRFGRSCYLGNLSNADELVEFDLLALLEKFGRVTEIRVDLNEKTGLNKGTGVVRFERRENAREAIQNLNDHEIRPNQKLIVDEFGLDLSMRLFMADHPRDLSIKQLTKELGEHIKGIRKIDIPSDGKKSYVFIDFISSEHAATAKQVLKDKSMSIFPGRRIIIDWAHSVSYTNLIVRNFSPRMSEEKLRSLFESHGKILRFKMNQDHAYVEYKSPFDTAFARDELNSKSIDSKELVVDPTYLDNSNSKDLKAKRPIDDKQVDGENEENEEPRRKIVRKTGPHTPPEPDKLAILNSTRPPLQTLTTNHSNRSYNSYDRNFHRRDSERVLSYPQSSSAYRNFSRY